MNFVHQKEISEQVQDERGCFLDWHFLALMASKALEEVRHLMSLVIPVLVMALEEVRPFQALVEDHRLMEFVALVEALAFVALVEVLHLMGSEALEVNLH